ncbi:MAG: hypothetical protein Q4E33_05350 [Erysipelotrichaceae bacterium]|nr:hypothetical protein [Erysipelotrichaceae bacterium]
MSKIEAYDTQELRIVTGGGLSDDGTYSFKKGECYVYDGKSMIVEDDYNNVNADEKIKVQYINCIYSPKKDGYIKYEETYRADYVGFSERYYKGLNVFDF